MLQSLHIENIAVIKNTDIDFTDGFNVLTGETGAGKSILIDSINLILGARPSKDLIRNGESRALVSAVFSDISEALARAEDLDIELEEDGCLYISREIDIEGKAKTKINGRSYPVSVQKELASFLISIHGQNDNRILLSPSAHTEYLDAFAENSELLCEYRKEYDAIVSTKKKINELNRDEKEKARHIELLKYQIADIDAAKLKPGEEEELEAIKDRLKNSEKIIRQSRLITKALYRNDKSLPAYELIKKAVTALESIGEYVEGSEGYIEKLNEAAYLLEDIGLTVQDISDSGADDPEAELDRIETRLDQIFKIKRKYGSDIEEVLAYREKSAKELSDIELGDVLISEYSKQLRIHEDNAYKLADILNQKREKGAKLLENGIIEELSYLEMPKVRFKVDISYDTDGSGRKTLHKNGYDNIEFLLSANPGEMLKPLARIASGGELSRIMLALKSVSAADTPGETLIFDEIDTGVSGKTSQKIGMKLHSLSRKNQVICVTHSAQIAAEADTQYLIKKNEANGRVHTTVAPLDNEGRVMEIARIMGGVNITEKIIDSAREMLEGSNS